MTLHTLYFLREYLISINGSVGKILWFTMTRPSDTQPVGFKYPLVYWKLLLSSNHTDAINRHINILGHICLFHIIFGNVISTKTSWYVLKKWTIGTINLEQTIAAKINSIEMMYRPINILLTLTDQSVKLWNFPRSIKGAQLLCMDYWVSTRLYITAERAARGLSEDWNLVTLCIQKSS